MSLVGGQPHITCQGFLWQLTFEVLHFDANVQRLHTARGSGEMIHFGTIAVSNWVIGKAPRVAKAEHATHGFAFLVQHLAATSQVTQISANPSTSSSSWRQEW